MLASCWLNIIIVPPALHAWFCDPSGGSQKDGKSRRRIFHDAANCPDGCW